ncbi:hypothetical protein [Nocardia concava]|uniref:hypothetical protein n=1 Tax=Nocardia concava TaxID=257281 RepID=UPI0005928188|nr:hypothetical protein [Nocardia concava]
MNGILTAFIVLGLVLAPVSIGAAVVSAARKEGVGPLIRDTGIHVAVFVACSIGICMLVLAILFGVGTVVEFMLNLHPTPD